MVGKYICTVTCLLGEEMACMQFSTSQGNGGKVQKLPQIESCNSFKTPPGGSILQHIRLQYTEFYYYVSMFCYCHFKQRTGKGERAAAVSRLHSNTSMVTLDSLIYHSQS